jgi:hypothetical protein
MKERSKNKFGKFLPSGWYVTSNSQTNNDVEFTNSECDVEFMNKKPAASTLNFQ